MTGHSGEYRLSFFVNATGTVPNFVYPVYTAKDGEGQFVADGDALAIKGFEVLGQALERECHSLPATGAVCLSKVDVAKPVAPGIPMLYAVEHEKGRVVCGQAAAMLAFVGSAGRNSQDTNTLWHEQVARFCERIAQETARGRDSLTLVMTKTSPEVCRLCRQQLPDYDIEVVVCPKNGRAAYGELAARQPDAVLLDLYMPGMDARAVKSLYSADFPESRTQFYVTGPLESAEAWRELVGSGVQYYFEKPFDIADFARRVLAGAGRQPLHQGAAALREERVAQALAALHLPAYLNGHRYLCDGVLMVAKEPALAAGVTKTLYPAIAQKRETTAARVDHAVHYAIQMIWDWGDAEALARYFGGEGHEPGERPDDSVFIAMLADYMTLTRRCCA